MKIGFFDSGVGGLYILESVRTLLPAYDYVYYGDTKNVPYGDKTEAEIFTLAQKGIADMFMHGVALCIVACNTVSVESLRALQIYFSVGQYADRKILGVVIPTVERVCELGLKKPILIGTVRTVTSQKYERELQKISDKIVLTSFATPELVPYIESDNRNCAEKFVDVFLGSMKGEYDALILGCTHYIYLKSYVQSRFEGQVISQDEIIPKKLFLYLERHSEIKNKLSRGRTLQTYMTGGTHTSHPTQTLRAIST